ncbi:acetyltransferase [Vallitalea longa]|uniref:Acetyltransferase n=1 Tax=Vallitalea longa TaxID=2936439 RepID=A0A9W5YB98_9FIRM|nr:acetyltransferase [Vallitalea longa]GKX30820.1 acetyltransferase [Vallitalea longa]
MQDIVVFGAGGHSKVIIDIIEREGKYSIIGLIDNYNRAESHFGYHILTDEIEVIMNNVYGGIIAIGDNWSRHVITDEIKSINPNFRFVSCISPNSCIAREVEIGEGSAIMAGAVINSSTRIGKHCIINSNSSIDHDNIIGDFVSIAPNVTTGGNVIVGDHTAVGLGTNVIHRINIGCNTVIGAGSTVIRDIGSYVVAYGIPCKVVRKRNKEDKYL